MTTIRCNVREHIKRTSASQGKIIKRKVFLENIHLSSNKNESSVQDEPGEQGVPGLDERGVCPLLPPAAQFGRGGALGQMVVGSSQVKFLTSLMHDL